MERDKKRKLIISIYLAIFLAIIACLYFTLKPKATCTDSIKNQNEEDVDCGGICSNKCKRFEAQPLQIQESGVLDAGVSGQYDFYALVTNPNNVFGSRNFNYVIVFKDAAGNIVGQKQSSGFILPGENKYVVLNNVALPAMPQTAEFKITDSDWMEFNSYYEKPDLKIINRTYNEITSGVGFSEAKGLLKNDSPYDFDSIHILVILKDSDGKVVALNSTEMKTIKSKEERDFRAFWPTRFFGNVVSIEAQPDVNVFSSDNFTKRVFKAEDFQRY